MACRRDAKTTGSMIRFGFPASPEATVRGIFGDPKAWIFRLRRRGKKRPVESVGRAIAPSTTASSAASATSPVATGGLPGGRGPAGLLPELRDGEAGEAGLAGRQPVLHQAVRLLRRPALSGDDHPGRGPGTAPRLEDGQGAGQAVHARATAPGRHPGTEGHRHRRDRPSRKGHTYRIVVSDLVRGRPIWFGGRTAPRRAWTSSSPGWAPRNAGKSAWPSWTCGRRSATPPSRRATRRRPASCTTSSTSCSTWARPWTRCARANTPGLRAGPALHQGAEVHAAVALGEPLPRREAGVEAAVHGQPAAEQGLPPQGDFRPTLGLPDGRLGAALLRPLACRPAAGSGWSPSRSSPA